MMSNIEPDYIENAWTEWHMKQQAVVEPEVAALAKRFRASVPTAKVLDLGCGTGRHAVYLARHGYEVLGLDGSASAVERAKLLADGVEGATFAVHDMHTPVAHADGSFDGVLALRAVHHGSTAATHHVLHELERLLKPSGFLVLQVPRFTDEYVDLEARQGRHYDVPEPQTLVPLQGPEIGVPHHLFTEAELRGVLSNFAIEDLHFGTPHYKGWCVVARKCTQSRA